MTFKLIITRLQLSNKKFITGEEIREYCKEISLDYYATIRYLTFYKYLVRIFKGIFYIKSIEERKLNKTDISYFEIIKKALEIKNINPTPKVINTKKKLNTNRPKLLPPIK